MDCLLKGSRIYGDHLLHNIIELKEPIGWSKKQRSYSDKREGLFQILIVSALNDDLTIFDIV